MRRLIAVVACAGLIAGCASSAGPSAGGRERPPRVEELELAEEIGLGPGQRVLGPRILESEPPVYPEELRRQRVEGDAVTRAVVTREGTLRDLTPIEASHELFARAALECLAGWRYEPATLDGVPVAVTIEIPIHFRLR